MKVVIDCNILVMCLSSKSPYHIIYQSLVQGKFNLVLSSEILLEYQEVLQQKYSVPTANALVALLKELPNVKFHTPFYNWLLIKADPDDNKYTDCAIVPPLVKNISAGLHLKFSQQISLHFLSPSLFLARKNISRKFSPCRCSFQIANSGTDAADFYDKNKSISGCVFHI